MTARSARSSRSAQPDQPGHEVEAGLDPGAEGDEPARQPARRPAARDAGDVDAGLTPVTGRDLDEALAERHDLRRRGALLRPEHGGGVTEAGRHVGGDDELDPPQCRRRSHGLVRAQAAVGRRGAAAADHNAAGPRVAGGQEELAHAGGGGAHRVVVPGPRQQGTPRGAGHLDHRRQGLVAVLPIHHAPFGLDPGPERAGHDGGVPGATQHQEQALSSVGHRHLVGGPSGGPGRAGHGGRHLPGGRRPPELVRRGDDVGHADEATGCAVSGTGVRARGFEPPPPFGDRDLNPARLPIPPRPQRARRAG